MSADPRGTGSRTEGETARGEIVLASQRGKEWREDSKHSDMNNWIEEITEIKNPCDEGKD